MPTPFLKVAAKKTGKSMAEVESAWERAKHASSDPENYAMITAIFKNMVGLKESEIKTMTFKQMMFGDD